MLDKTSHDDLTKLVNEFRLFKTEMQQQMMMTIIRILLLIY